MLALAASSFAIALACVSLPPEPLQVNLDFGPATTPVAALALAEAARVWAPYHVFVQRASGAVEGTGVRVTIADRAPSSTTDARALGSIEFRNGAPVPQIALFKERAWEVICAVAGRSAERWPMSYREMILGRVLGRALAHELGHYLLQSKQHAAAGLMRPSPSIADLMADGRTAMFLTSEDLAALARGHTTGPM